MSRRASSVWRCGTYGAPPDQTLAAHDLSAPGAEVLVALR